VGVDLGGTKVQAVKVVGDEVVASSRRSTPPGGPDAVVAVVAEAVRELGELRDVAAVGVGAPGAIEAGSGVVRRAPNLEGFDVPVPLGPLLADALGGVTVAVDNDVNVAALAEHRLGAGAGSDDLLAVFVGTGVGGGLVLGGQVRRGPGGVAGEIGHVVVKDGGRRCGCGGRGHLEAYAGRAGMERTARKRAAGGTKTKLVKLAGDGRMKSSVFARALEDGDRLARELVDEAAEALGAALASAVALVDLDRVVLGGGLGDRLGPPFVQAVQRATHERLFVPEAPFSVVPAALGDLAGARGAALLAGAR
jgi:glucokinase